MIVIPANANAPSNNSLVSILLRKNKGSITADNKPVVARQVSAIDTLAYFILP
jgi:hypothetical protein